MKSVAVVSILTLLATVPSVQAAPFSDTRLEGHVLGFDGRPAAGWRVHLIDGAGQASAGADVDDDGAYRMRGVESGRYSLALETPDGRYAAVEGPELQLRRGHLVRRDLKLMHRDPASAGAGFDAATQFGAWWAGLDGAARAWTIVAVVLVVGISADALSSDEGSASTVTP